jgi:hypothetical protein
MQPDVSFAEWCDLYYPHTDPEPDQIRKACETALPILHRNNVLDVSVTEFRGMTDEAASWPRRDDPNPREPEEITEILKARNLAEDKERFEIEGPWAFRGLDGYETPIYIFQKGTGEKVEIGKAVATISEGLKFAVEIQEAYKDVKSAGFEAPMRYNIRPKQ